MKKTKITYPFSDAEAMGSSGIRCSQIIDNPIDRRIPFKIDFQNENYVLHYLDPMEEYFCSRRVELFSLPFERRPKSLLLSRDMHIWILKSKKYAQSLSLTAYNFVEEKQLWGFPYRVQCFGMDPEEGITFLDFAGGYPSGGYLPPMEKTFLFGERGPEPILLERSKPLPKYVGIDLARPGSERTVIHITNPGGDERIRAMYEAEARKKISAAFHIPEKHLRRDGAKFIYDKKAPQKPEERVYDASAWTGRKSREPSPDLTLAEAVDELKAALRKEAGSIADWLRSWTIKEYYFGEDDRLVHKTSFILALRRKDREIIRRHVELKNGVRKLENAFFKFGRSIAPAINHLQSKIRKG